MFGGAKSVWWYLLPRLPYQWILQQIGINFAQIIVGVESETSHCTDSWKKTIGMALDSPDELERHTILLLFCLPYLSLVGRITWHGALSSMTMLSKQYKSEDERAPTLHKHKRAAPRTNPFDVCRAHNFSDWSASLITIFPLSRVFGYQSHLISISVLHLALHLGRYFWNQHRALQEQHHQQAWLKPSSADFAYSSIAFA